MQSDCAKAVARTPTQLAPNRLHTAQMATLMSNKCWSVLEVSIGCSDVKIRKFFLLITIDTFWFLSIIIDSYRY